MCRPADTYDSGGFFQGSGQRAAKERKNAETRDNTCIFCAIFADKQELQFYNITKTYRPIK